MDTPQTQAALISLQQAISLGVTEVYYGDKRVGYRSLDEMLRVEVWLKKALGITPNSGRKYAEFNKGLNCND